MIKEITPPQAWKLVQSENNTVIIDVRSSMEFEYVGHPVGAIHVPWQQPPNWQPEPGFVQDVCDALEAVHPGANYKEDIQVLALCRSGARSHSAGEALLSNGFKNVYNIIEGFEGDKNDNNHRNTLNGWRVHGLPWEQS
jgi:rhodanese-related sulfurtransferase